MQINCIDLGLWLYKKKINKLDSIWLFIHQFTLLMWPVGMQSKEIHNKIQTTISIIKIKKMKFCPGKYPASVLQAQLNWSTWVTWQTLQNQNPSTRFPKWFSVEDPDSSYRVVPTELHGAADDDDGDELPAHGAIRKQLPGPSGPQASGFGLLLQDLVQLAALDLTAS